MSLEEETETQSSAWSSVLSQESRGREQAVSWEHSWSVSHWACGGYHEQRRLGPGWRAGERCWAGSTLAQAGRHVTPPPPPPALWPPAWASQARTLPRPYKVWELGAKVLPAAALL